MMFLSSRRPGVRARQSSLLRGSPKWFIQQRRRIRRRGRYDKRTKRQLLLSSSILLVLFLCCCFLLTTWTATFQPSSSLRRLLLTTQPDLSTLLKGNRYLIFTGLYYNQGIGNIVHGLLAAHLLGLEFNRTVCLSKKMQSFYDAFEVVHDETRETCRFLMEQQQHSLTRQPAPDELVSLVNFDAPPNECALQHVLRSTENPILYVQGNTYPRWPVVVPDNFFFTYYRPRPIVTAILSYDHSPEIVVHLRKGDSAADDRRGCSKEALDALGKWLPADTYLITNHAPWFDYVATEFGWRHPNWQAVTHSVEDIKVAWGSRNSSTSGEFSTAARLLLQKLSPEEQQNLQAWADWLTILRAKKVYHSHSDFSLSAIHWMNVDSRTIDGVVDGNVSLIRESWRTSRETERLVDRVVETADPSAKLQLCDQPIRTIRGDVKYAVRPKLVQY